MSDSPYPPTQGGDLSVLLADIETALEWCRVDQPTIGVELCDAALASLARLLDTLQNGVLLEIAAERERQDAKWGGVPGIERRDDHTYAAVLGEEFGETCKAWLERDVRQLRAELVQVAAVAVAWVEEIDNGGGWERSRFAPMHHRDAALLSGTEEK